MVRLLRADDRVRMTGVYPARTIMSAYYRRRGEDRVTEVLAAVLDGAIELLHGLARAAGLPPAVAYDVRTQVSSGNVRIDLEITGRDAEGTTTWLLWSEHKVNDPLTATQLENETNALRTRAGLAHSHLIAVTLFAPTPGAVAFAETSGCTLLRWRDVTNLARTATEQMTSPRSDPVLMTVAAHLLEEWIEFAKNELEAPVEGLTPERVLWLPEVEKALETLGHLLAAGFTRACAQVGAGAPREVDEELHATPPQGSWLEERGFSLYARYAPDEGFGGVHEPCLVVGAWIEDDDAVSARRSREFHTVLATRGFGIWDEEGRHGGWIEFGVPIPLAELASHGSLEEQDDVFGAVCLRTLRSLVLPVE